MFCEGRYILGFILRTELRSPNAGMLSSDPKTRNFNVQIQGRESRRSKP